MSVVDSITALQTSSYTVTRYATGSYTAGVWTPGAPVTSTIIGHIQPVSGYALQVLPEGMHAENTRCLYTKTALQGISESGKPDTITIDSEVWDIKVVERWEGLGTTHYKAYICRQEVP